MLPSSIGHPAQRHPEEFRVPFFMPPAQSGNIEIHKRKGGGGVPLIQIFRAGTHTDMNGVERTFTEKDVETIAAFYDPAKHEAPCVIGHPKSDDPAYGWAKGLVAQNGDLFADVDQVDPEFSEMVDKGRFKKISAKFYPPGHPSNYSEEGWGLCHIGFLGAQPPAVKGLKPVQLGEDDGECVVVEFGDTVDRYVPRMFQKLRDFFIEEFGLEEADKAIDQWDVQWLTEGAAADRAADGDLAFSESDNPNPKENKVSKEKEAVLKQREDDLAKREAAFAEAEARSEADAFVNALIADGKMTEGLSDGVAASMAKLPDGKDDMVAFAEGDDVKKITPREFFKGLLTNLGTVAEFSEVSADDGEGDGIDMNAQELATEAMAFMESQKAKGIEMTSVQAVEAVKAGKHKE
jgi:hypothetical protein